MAQTMGAETTTLLGTLPEQAGITLGRFAEAEEVADPVLFLASERASAVSGSDYMIDGDMLKTT
jgi:NAD(P)-dependent dehydrogenase (short-subunit alcohol dehydrogenase family)